MQRNDPPLLNDLLREITRVINLCREIHPGVIFLRRIMTRVILLRSEMTHGSFCREGHFSALHQLAFQPGIGVKTVEFNRKYRRITVKNGFLPHKNRSLTHGARELSFIAAMHSVA